MAAIKKSELYSSLWASCDALRGGMDASQYKDYILTLLFVKYVSDKFKGDPYADIIVPEGGSFDDMVAILGNSEKSKNIGEEMDKIVAKLAEANDLTGVIDNAHFNDELKMGKGKEMVDKLTKLINIFRREELNFKNNRAEGDDIIGDAYEYLMRKFATESGKSKGQFYTPAEVSRVLAKVIGIKNETDSSATVYDPACGSGSLLIRALDEASVPLAGYGQEKDTPTAGLAKMNTVLHGKAATTIVAGNTFSEPKYFETSEKETLKRFDYIVANPPFSTKNWTDGLVEYGRFDGFCDEGNTKIMPPEKNGDYAWLLHIIKSLKSNGKAAVILPHGVLFRGNAEETLRKKIIDKGYIKGIISLPANLFYGTGIPACIIVIDKETADTRDSIFIIDASHGFVKDGNKNRLREQDVYRIIKTFNEEIVDDPKYARKVPISEIKSAKNNYNLNIPRYIDSAVKEDSHDLNAHLNGGIPMADIDNMSKYWNVLTALKNKLVSELRTGYYKLNVALDEVNSVVSSDEQYVEYSKLVDDAFMSWRSEVDTKLRNLNEEVSVKDLIVWLSEKLVEGFESLELLDKYDVYQVLLSYWLDTMADDIYLICKNGFGVAKELDYEYKRKKEKNENGEEIEVPTTTVKSWDGKVLPKTIIINEFFASEKEAVDLAESQLQSTISEIDEMIENATENTEFFDLIDDGKIDDKKLKAKIEEIRGHIKSDDIDVLTSLIDVKIGKKEISTYLQNHPVLSLALTDKGTINASSIKKAITQLRNSLPVPEAYKEDYDELVKYGTLLEKKKEFSDAKTALSKDLEAKLLSKYAEISIEEVIELVVNKKWYYAIYDGIEKLFDGVAKNISNRISVLAKRYESTLGDIDSEIDKVSGSLASLVSELEGDDFDNAGILTLKKLLGIGDGE